MGARHANVNNAYRVANVRDSWGSRSELQGGDFVGVGLDGDLCPRLSARNTGTVQGRVDVGEYSPFLRQMASPARCFTGQQAIRTSVPRPARENNKIIQAGLRYCKRHVEEGLLL